MIAKYPIKCIIWITGIFLLSHLTSFSQSRNISGQINTYTNVINIDSTCNYRIFLGSVTGLKANDTFLIIQMKGAVADSSNTASFGSVINIADAGNYEIGIIASVGTNYIKPVYTLINHYTIKGKVQLIRVPSYLNANVTGSLTAPDWNNSTGGVLAMIVKDTLNLKTNIDISGTGFAGGKQSITNSDYGISDYYMSAASGQGGQKGEGITQFTNAVYQCGKGPLTNGGGGGDAHNCGGGGGSNAGAGGIGGRQVESGGPTPSNGGRGGLSINSPLYGKYGKRIFMGGGGGGAHQNNGSGTDGVNGGGIIIIKCGTIIGNNQTLLANGASVTIASQYDGSGGGGGGGTILLDAGTISGTVTIRVDGGAGGDNEIPYSQCTAPGGGGGGGVIWMNQPSVPAAYTISENPGRAGVINASQSPCNGSNYDATGGLAGASLFKLTVPQSARSISGGKFDTSEFVICKGTSITIKASHKGISYRWNTNDTTSSITVNQPGLYSVLVNTLTCGFTDYVNVNTIQNYLGHDTELCHIKSLILNAGNTGAIYLWSTGDTTGKIKVTKSGTYFVQVKGNGCVQTDSIHVNFIPVADTSYFYICAGNPVNIKAIRKGISYLWNTGDTTPSITVNKLGIYSVLVHTPTCDITDYFNIGVLSNYLGRDTIACEDAAVILDAHNPGASYHWNTGDTTRKITVIQPGMYKVLITAKGCQTKDSIKVSFVYPPKPYLGADTNVCADFKRILDAGPGYKYTWEPGGDTVRAISIDSPATYSVKVTDSAGCSGQASVTITDICVPVIFVPDVFTPDGNGINDMFLAKGEYIKSFEMDIYNRWGEHIFQSDDIRKGWDGRFKGNKCPVDVYLWIIYYKGYQANKFIYGTVSLLR